MSKIDIEINEVTLKGLVRKHISDMLKTPIKDEEIKIQVKSKQNYRAEWETASFRATVHKDI